MATKKKAAKKRVATKPVMSPEAELVKLYGDSSEDALDRVEVRSDNSFSVDVDVDTISEVDEVQELPGCCGVDVLAGVDNIAPSTAEGYPAVGALLKANLNGGAGLLATTIPSQKTAAAFFRANGWLEIVLGCNGRGGNVITLWVLAHGRKS